jgi:hypothetical protein
MLNAERRYNECLYAECRGAQNKPKCLHVLSFSWMSSHRVCYVKVMLYDVALLLNIKLTEKSQRLNTLACFTAASVKKGK